MVNEILEAMREIKSFSKYMDGTLGRGGHLHAVLKAFPAVKAIALDKDLDAIEYAKIKFTVEIHEGRLEVLHVDFNDIEELRESTKIGETKFDAILLDLGISSPQIDTPERGFSFLYDGPLDMRMNQSQVLTAATIINEWDEDELIRIFREYGEVDKPSRVVRAIVNDRKESPFTSTAELAGLIARVEGWKKKGFHPATQYFMALRIEVNGELNRLENTLRNMIELLSEGGRLFVISFHSLEDRIVKSVMNELSLSLGYLVNKKVIVPTETEQSQNPRSRSSKLRIFEKNKEKSGPRVKTDKYAHKKGSQS